MGSKIESSPGVTPLMRAGLRIFKATFGRMHPFIIDIEITDTSTVRVRTEKSKLKLIPWMFSSIFIMGFSLISCVYSIGYEFILPGKQLNTLEITTFLFWTSMWIFQISVCSSILKCEEFVSAINYTFTNMCQIRFLLGRPEKKLDIPGLLLFNYMLSTVLTLPLSAFTVALKIDFYHVVNVGVYKICVHHTCTFFTDSLSF
ncbi:unnamed protein product [Orchesella dallaii]|uniref:Uncharacterized protein n=1 Tax=Orchesella dallaii TaxID=48710 RepID=A0ABP1PJI1_9HEXA